MPNVRAEQLQSLAAALTLLANRVQTRDSAATDFQRLKQRAELIARRARDLQTSKWAADENATKLQHELSAFAEDVAAAAARAAAEVSGNAAIAEALLDQAQRLGETASRTGHGAPEFDLASELRPLELTLSHLHARMQQESRIAEEAGRLARQAAQLASRATTLRAQAPDAVAAAAIHGALLSFVNEASSIAARIQGGSAGLQQAAAIMAQQSKQLATAPKAHAVTWLSI